MRDANLDKSRQIRQKSLQEGGFGGEGLSGGEDKRIPLNLAVLECVFSAIRAPLMGKMEIIRSIGLPKFGAI